MSSVVSVDFRPPVNEQFVEMLEGLLAKAKAGDLVSGRFAGSRADGGVFTAFSSTNNAILEIAAVAQLLHRLHMSMDEAAK